MTQPVTIRITRRAAGHIARAADWWNENRPFALGAVRDEFEQAVALLRVQPYVGSLTASTRAKGVRRIHLSRIHYFLFYRVQAGRVDILALWHTSRGVGLSI